MLKLISVTGREKKKGMGKENQRVFAFLLLLLSLTGSIVVSVSPPAVQACKHSEKKVGVYRDFVFSSSLEETVLSSRKEVRKLSGHGLFHMTSEGL